MIKQKQLKYKDILYKILIYSFTIFTLSENIYANVPVKCKKYKEITVKQLVTQQECIDNVQISSYTHNELSAFVSGRLFDDEFSDVSFVCGINCNDLSYIKGMVCFIINPGNVFTRNEKIEICEEWEIEEGDIKELAKEVIKAMPSKVVGKIYDPNLVYE